MKESELKSHALGGSGQVAPATARLSVPAGIDDVAGDLGARPRDSRVTSPTAIAADEASSAGK